MCKTRKTSAFKGCLLLSQQLWLFVKSIHSDISNHSLTALKGEFQNPFSVETLRRKPLRRRCSNIQLSQEFIPAVLLNSAEIEIFWVHFTSKKSLRDPTPLLLNVVLTGILRNRYFTACIVFSALSNNDYTFIESLNLHRQTISVKPLKRSHVNLRVAFRANVV